MPTAAQTTSLQTVLAGLAGGSSSDKITGTKQSGPVGIESIIEYRSKAPIYLNVVDWVDTFLIVTINGLDSADLRASAQVNPGEIGETPNDALWGGRTITLSGKQYAGTIWKLRDMQQGLRGSFLDVRNEYPLIFHALDPVNDLMIMCKLADKINIPDQQTVKNQHVRDFQITLRASNPRFLSVVREQKAMITLTSAISFDKDNVPTIENFSVPGGLSNTYVEKGYGYTAGSDLLTQRDLLRNMIVNSRGDTPLTPLSGVEGNYNWNTGGGGTDLSVLPTGGISNPDTGVGPAFLMTTTSGVGRREADIEFSSHASSASPPVIGGERVRVTGWIRFEQIPGPETSVGIALRWWVYPDGGTLTRVLAPIPLTDAGISVKTTNTPWLVNTWYRVDATVTVPSQVAVKAFPSAVFYVTYQPGNDALINLGAFRMRVAEPMMDIDRDPSRGVLYGDGTYPGWGYEGQAKYSIARRKALIANMLRNTRAFISAANGASSDGATLVRHQESDPNKYNKFVDHNTWWRLVSDGSGAHGGEYFVPPDNAPRYPMWLTWNFMKVAEKTTYNFSFYARSQDVSRRVYVMVAFLTPAGNPTVPYAIYIPEQTHGIGGQDVMNEWRRFWVDIPIPAGVINAIPYVLFTTDDNTPIPDGETHEVSAAMFSMGSGPRGYRDASGAVGGRPMPEYTWVGAANDSPTLGPWAFRNLLPDSDSNKADSSAKAAVASILEKVASGGAIDNGQFSRAVYDSSGAFYMGVAAQAVVSERTTHSVSAYVRLPPGVSGSRNAVIDIWWHQDTASPATKLSSTMSLPVSITSDWSEITMDNVIPPDRATVAVVRVLLSNPVIGDVIDTDRIMMSNAPQSDGWFGIKSEWAQAADPANQFGEALRYAYSAYLTPRKFYEGQQTVKLLLPATNTGDDTVHLALAYIDDDNQIYASLENPNLMTLCRRDQGTFTQLANVTLTTQADNFNYYFRARMADGVVFAEAGLWDMDAPIAGNPLPVQLKYVMTTSEVAKYQDVLLPMRFGIQARGGNWIVDEWRYTDMSQPEGWTVHEGAGTVSVKGNKLVPLDGSPKMMIRSELTYKVSDAAIGAKFRLTDKPAESQSWQAGLVSKVNAIGNSYLYATWGHRTPPAGGGGFTIGYRIGCVINGVEYEFWAQEGNMPQNVNIWLRIVTVGNLVKIEDWRTDPALGGTVFDTVGIDLTDPVIGSSVPGGVPTLVANFGAGVKGDFGIIWPEPIPLTNVIDDFTFTLATFDDIAFTFQNRGNFEAQTTISLTGPMTNPRVTNEANGSSFKINATIPVGETWVMENVGPSKRMYRKSDGANRFQYLDQTSMWVVLEPGNVLNSIRLTATSLAAGWDMQVSYRHTYM